MKTEGHPTHNIRHQGVDVVHPITARGEGPAAERKIKQAHMSVSSHIEELRRRLMWSLGMLFIAGVFGYMLSDQIIALLIKPLGQTLYYTSPTGGFDFLIKICLFFGFLVAAPVLVYNLFKFISPAMPSGVTLKTYKVMIISVLLAVAGASFAYFVSLPSALHFLSNFSDGPITSLITANEYFTFVMIFIAGFAAFFQIPLIISFINKITPLSPKKLMKKQRVVILASFIIAAIITPTPDPLNQALMAVPMITLYQVSIGVTWHSNRKNKSGSPGVSMGTPLAI